jgi:protease secretion system membrane fusion protein
MTNKKFNQSSKSFAENANVINASEDNEVRASSDTRSVARTGLWILGLGFGGFLLWQHLHH